VHHINTRNKHHFHRLVANLSCFQKGASYSGIRIFNSLSRSITNFKNEKTHFKVALKKFLNAHFFYSLDEFFTCTDDTYYWLHDCLNVSFTVIFLCVCMFMTCSTSYCLVTLKDLWNAYVYVCMYVTQKSKFHKTKNLGTTLYSVNTCCLRVRICCLSVCSLKTYINRHKSVIFAVLRVYESWSLSWRENVWKVYLRIGC